MHQKLVPDPFLFLLNNLKQPCMQVILLTVRCFERGLFKSLEKASFIFFMGTQSFLIVKIMKNKSGLELVTSHS